MYFLILICKLLKSSYNVVVAYIVSVIILQLYYKLNLNVFNLKTYGNFFIIKKHDSRMHKRESKNCAHIIRASSTRVIYALN